MTEDLRTILLRDAERVLNRLLAHHVPREAADWDKGDRLVDEISAFLAEPLTGLFVDRDRIGELVDEGAGFWRACSGCQDSVDGHVSTRDYPHSRAFRCQPGGGCRECGGIGVVWDNTDYSAMVEAMIAEGALDDAPDSGEAGEGRDERLWWFMTILAGAGGESDASESKWAWINAFCDDRPGAASDTFNLANDLGLATTSHCTSFDTSTVRMTEAGRAYLALEAAR